MGIPANRDLAGNPDVVYVHSYVRSDGTEVRAHYRSKAAHAGYYNNSSNIGFPNLSDFMHKYIPMPTGGAADMGQPMPIESVMSGQFSKGEVLERGKPMSVPQARKNINPIGDRNNCQTCVVTYEARLRGYDVEALSNDKTNIMVSTLESNQNMAWIDPKTGKIPLPTLKYSLKNEQDCYDWLNNTIQNNERYTLAWRWKNEYIGHIVSIDKDNFGNLRIYDPQSNIEISGKEKLLYYMKDFAYESPLKILRVDNLDLFLPIVNKVIKPSKN